MSSVNHCRQSESVNGRYGRTVPFLPAMTHQKHQSSF